MIRISTRGRGIVAVLGASALITAVAAAPAHAGTTGTTFALAGGTLSISEPATADLGSVNTGAASISGSLGPVTVTDNRGALLSTWTATAATTDFTTGGATANETVPKANVGYTPGLATASSGTAVFLGVPVLSMTGTSTVFTATGVVGNNSATWDPTIAVTLPGAAVAGTYSGTITHSVS